MSEVVVVEPITSVVVIQQAIPVVAVAGTGAQGATGATGEQGLTPIFTRQNDINPIVGNTRFYFDGTRTIGQIRASVGTPSTGAPIVVDTLINGVSIGMVSIPAGQNTATISPATTVLANDYATVSILSVGSTIAGADLTLVLTIN
jgi:hypothetical protein